MVVGPHPIEVTVNDTDNSTKKEGATVYVSNVTKKSKVTATNKTNSSGLTIVDLANLPLIVGQTNEYDQGDRILIITYDGINHDAALYTVTGDSKSQTLNLNPIRHNQTADTVRLQAILGANTTGSGAFAKVYSVNDGELLAQLEVPANDQRDHIFGGERGKGANGGFVVEREATGLVVTATMK